MKPLSLNLTLRSCWSTYTRQKKRFSTVCKSWHSQDHKAEGQAIEDALASLRILQREKLSFPDWKKE